jgi:hypothetical protein
LRGLFPSEQADEAILEDESYAYTSVESAKIGGHGRNGEVWALHIGPGAPVFDAGGCRSGVGVVSFGGCCARQVLGREDLRKKSNVDVSVLNSSMSP